MTFSNTTDAMKITTTIMSSILVTGAIAWWTFGNGVSQAEGEDLKKIDIELQKEQAVVGEKLAEQQRSINEIKINVKENNAQTQQKLDRIIENLPRK